MMGKDVERLLEIMDGIKPLVIEAINTLSTAIQTTENDYEDPEAVVNIDPVDIPTIYNGSYFISEINNRFGIVENNDSGLKTWTKNELNKLINWDKNTIKQLFKEASNPFEPIKTYMEETEDDRKKFKQIETKMFSKSNSFFNSIGSPFNEYNVFLEAYENAKSYASSHSSLKYIGEKIAMISLLNVLIPLITDFKTMLINYNDYIQRGYDLIFNDGVPSITIQRSKNNKSNGNISQKTNNVDVPQKSIDPY